MKMLGEETGAKTAEMEHTTSGDAERMRLEVEMQRRLKHIEAIRPLVMLTESRYRELRERYGFFWFGMGAAREVRSLEEMAAEEYDMDEDWMKTERCGPLGAAAVELTRFEPIGDSTVATATFSRGGGQVPRH